MEIGLIRASDGTEVELTEDMLEDLYILSDVYNVPIKDLIRSIFNGELKSDATVRK